MFRRVKDAIDAGREAVAAAENVPPAPRPYSALLLLDELGPVADATRPRHSEAAKSKGERVLLILGPDSELEHPDVSVVCEFLPRLADIVSGTGHRPDVAQFYRLARLRLILEKWDVVECRWTGPLAAELIELWSSQGLQTSPVTFLPAH